MINISKLQRKAAAFIATSALLLSSFAPAALAAGTTDLTISGNGADSTNDVNSNVTSTSTVVQNNDATVTNAVTVTGDTGNNTADKNTGGSVSIGTGDATARVSLETTANLNKVVSPDCNCTDSNLNATISGNGADSTSHINTNTTNANSVFQANSADITNAVTTDLTTGYNKANENTGGLGGGDVSILTGNAGANVSISNKANANLALLGGPGTGGSVTNLTISGNGADSHNSIGLNHTRSNTIVQDNYADFTNAVTVYAITGHNKANENTNDSVFVGTGDTAAIVSADNLANFNFASADCGCLLADNKTISGNGADSNNHINQNLTDTLSLFQGEGRTDSQEWGSGNNADFVNALTVGPTTGHNYLNENTRGLGEGYVDVLTGDSGSLVEVSNKANANLFGTLALPGGTDLGFNFNLGSLLGV